MATYDIRPLQLKILEILLTLDKVCKEHNLRYFIMAGTMLGAVRHKGFIPWDDDSDVGMPRADYDLLIANAKQWLPEQYQFICAENDSSYPLPFAKIQDANTTLIERIGLKYVGGIFLDVFPLDGVPNRKISQKIHFARYQFYRKALYFVCRDPYKHGKGIRSWIPLLFRKFFTPKNVQQSIRNILTKYDFDKSTFVADYDDGINGIMNKKIVGTPTPVLFEGKEVFGIENSDVYLRQKYGNYMEIPKQAKQRQHNFYLLDINKPYKEYEK